MNKKLLTIMIILTIPVLVLYTANTEKPKQQLVAKSKGVKKPNVLDKAFASRELVDKIVARVNGTPVLLSDLHQPRIDKHGETFSPEEAIDNVLLFQKAAEKKLLPSNTDIEKYVAAWKEANNLSHLSDEEFEKRLKKDKLSGKKYRTQLRQIRAINSLRQMEASEAMLVTSREIEEYNRKNPEEQEERYLLQTVIIDAQNAKEAAQKANDLKLEWINIDWTDKSDITEQMSLVHSMKEEEISSPVKTDDGYQLVKLLQKEAARQRTLDERWVEIERAIQDSKMAIFDKKFIKQLREDASIVYLS